MTQTKFTPEIIANTDSLFSIPLYQRLFEWDTEQINVLLSDLWHSFINNEKNYYIGMLTSTQNNELVDGQQRFVIMTLIGCALKDYDFWRKFIEFNGEPRLKFKSRDNDDKYLKSLIDGKTVKSPNLKMDNAVKQVKLFFEKDDVKPKRTDFAQYIYQHLSFFISILPENYSGTDLNTYFERMNTTGKNLEQHEILKVKMLKHLGNSDVYMQLWNKLADVDTVLIRKHDKETEDALRDRKRCSLQVKSGEIIDELIRCKNEQRPVSTINWKDKSDEESISIADIKASNSKPSTVNVAVHSSRGPLSFEQLLLNVLYYTIEDKTEIKNIDEFFKTSNLLETFSKHLPYEGENINVKEISKFIGLLLKARLTLDICFIRPTEDGYSLDMLLTEDTEEAEQKDALLMYESMLYVSSGNATNYRWFGWLMDKIKNDIPSPEDLLKELKTKDNTEHPMPDHDKLSFNNIDRYWFWRLDYYLWEKRNKYFKGNALALKVADNYVFRRNRSVEHIAPQTPKSDSTIKWDDSDEDTNIRNSFGNLAMISSSLNSKLQNESYEIKRANVESYYNGSKIGTIESLKMLWVYTKYSTWDKEIIQQHQNEMIEILRESY